VERALGGAATYFAVAASFFAPVSLVAIVGDDFAPEDEKIFRGRAHRHGRPGARCGQDILLGRALFPELERARNVGDRTERVRGVQARLPEKYRSSKYVFLANIAPDLQAGRASPGQEAPQNRSADT